MALLKGSYSIANVSPDRILKYVGKYFIVFKAIRKTIEID